jgi:hypothetical protein
MNYYVVVEGIVEKKVYEKWIPFINNQLIYVDHPSKLTDNNFVIVSGGGYPNYLQIITDAIKDIRLLNQPIRLIACVDSEDFTRNDKYIEIDDHIKSQLFANLKYHIVIQHFCFETWALGNRRIGPRKPKHTDLIKYKQHYNVMVSDPEELPKFAKLNRSQFAEIYLRRMLLDKNSNITYSKNNPDEVTKNTFFSEVKTRVTDTEHNDSFNEFMNAFS